MTFRKAWNRMKGFGPMEAQTLYLESLIQILTEVQQTNKHLSEFNQENIS